MPWHQMRVQRRGDERVIRSRCRHGGKGCHGLDGLVEGVTAQQGAGVRDVEKARRLVDEPPESGVPRHGRLRSGAVPE